jgi:hypothetical protein
MARTATKTAPISLPKRANQSVGGVDGATAPVKVSRVRTDNSEKTRKAEMEKDLRKISRETGAKRISTIEQERRDAEKAKAPKPVGHLAAGLDGRNSPHSAKAVQDNRAAAKKGAPAAAPKPADKKAARVAAKAATAAPKADDKRAITIVKKDFAFGREGTARRQSWDVCLKAKTAAAYIAAGGAAKYLPRWVSAGAIKLG